MRKRRSTHLEFQQHATNRAAVRFESRTPRANSRARMNGATVLLIRCRAQPPSIRPWAERWIWCILTRLIPQRGANHTICNQPPASLQGLVRT
jgi:hypothetical protein